MKDQRYQLSFFPLYPKDFLGDTGSLTSRKFGIYCRLLFTSWFTPLLDDMEELCAIARDDEQHVSAVLQRYFDLVDGVWVNHRQEKERGKAYDKHCKRVAAGKRGALLKQSSSNAGSNAIASQNPEPRTQNPERTTPSGGRFAPPSIEEITAYMIDRGLQSDKAAAQATRFFDHHEARGWILGNRQKMKDWRAAVRTWIGNMPKFGESSTEDFSRYIV